MTPELIAAYLARIGASRPGQIGLDTLSELQERQLHAVPFENLSIHLGERVVLSDEGLLDKIGRGRGGFCYELNGAFALLLRSLGFDVTLLAAKVYRPDGSLGPPFDHLTLRVDLDEPWLVDVGFGAFARQPLRLTPGPQEGVAGTYSVRVTEDGDLQVSNGDKPAYLVEQRPRVISDFEPTAWWQSTSPDSHFTQSLTCSLSLAGGARVTLSGDKLIETAAGGERTERVLASDDEVRAAYAELFGIRLTRLPVVLHPRA